MPKKLDNLTVKFYSITFMSMIHIRDGFPEQRQIILREDETRVCKSTPLLRDLIVTDIGHFPQTHYHLVERLAGCDRIS